MLHYSFQSRLQTQHLILQDRLYKYPAELLQNRVDPNKWSVYENFAHLVSYQPVYLERMQQILMQPNPTFKPWSGDTDKNFLEYCHYPLERLLPILMKEREQVIDLVASLSPSEGERMGTHHVYGSMSLLEWTELFILHESHHIFTMFKLLHHPNNKLVQQ
ncbi:DinB family protein [Chitinophaga skermanii]|uniref:DinB family protein n=1 Tax=Chitinophaga skermanii TaxID=331697 RepID=A0A327QYS0_9BACT|nr:DinB family protein [Chitinophaga skermanii]RAJ08908.1 DinB family protein [Chitinophaga skermanii]